MSFYSRKFLICICCLQIIATVEWQVFNFLGYMWTPILICFLHFIFILVGLFGAAQYRPRCAIVYLMWQIIWIGINAVIICIYLEVGILRKNSTLLNFGLGNKSWWFDHGFGCRVNTTQPAYTGVRGVDSVLPAEVEVSGCLLHYTYIEVIHAGIQIMLSIFGIIGAICLAHILRNDEDTSQPVKTSEMEYINMRRSGAGGGKLPPAFVNLNEPVESGRRIGETPPPQEFDTLVTEVDTLSPHHSRNASHESLQPMPPQRLSANRLLRDSNLHQINSSSVAASPHHQSPNGQMGQRTAPSTDSANESRRRSNRRRSSDGKRRSRRAGREGRSGASIGTSEVSSYLGAGDSSLDRRSVFSRDSHSTRAREPLPWVVAAALPLEEEQPASQRASDDASDCLPPYQPPPYTAHPASPPSPALYIPPQPPRNTSPYENWPSRPLPNSTQPPRTRHPGYENAWSPVPPLAMSYNDRMGPSSNALSHQSPPQPPSSNSGRPGVIFFRTSSGSGVGGEVGDRTGLSYGGSVVV